MKNNHSQYEKGFSLVEMMVSLALFVTVTVVGVGAILAANTASRKTQDLRQVMDTLNFALEDFSRTARLGRLYKCGYESDQQPPANIPIEFIELVDGNDDGVDCNLVSYEPFIDLDSDEFQDQVIYVFATFDDGDGEETALLRSPKTYDASLPLNIDNMVRITPGNIVLDMEKSGFDVLGSDPNDNLQPRMVMRLTGTVTTKNESTQFNLSTMVTQRILDI